MSRDILQRLTEQGHYVQEHPDETTDILVTTARFGEPLQWRTAPFFQAKRQYRLRRAPTVFTIIHVKPAELLALTSHLAIALAKEPPDPADFEFPGLAPNAHKTLIEQGRRGGPILAIERVMQGQALCLRVIVVVGENEPVYAYHFDLVGAYAESRGTADAMLEDIGWRIATAASTESVGKPKVMLPEIPQRHWATLLTPNAMQRASLEFSKRDFFTEMVRIADLVQVPALGDAIASQYSEGCFATWDPDLQALVTTVTGSARPVDKRNITDDELAVVVGVAPDGASPTVRHVEGLRNDPPSSEGFEMFAMDSILPTVTHCRTRDSCCNVPVTRSKLHSHRGVSCYDPRFVEYVPMASCYFQYPITCGTSAQADGLRTAFAHSEALGNPDDPRQVVFTILPTHGVFIVEKWVAGKMPFQVIWEYMDAGHLQIARQVPQGPDVYFPRQRSGEGA